MTSLDLDSPQAIQTLYRRSLSVVVVSQVFGGAGLAAGVTVGALLAQDLLGAEQLAGLPVALTTVGSALAAFLVGRGSQRAGRRVGLAAGFFTGAAGALGIVLAAVLRNPPLLFVSLFVYGAGTATNLQARYAGTDLARSNQRGTAVSVAMVSTTVGAVAGPNLVGVTGRVAVSVGIPALAGPFALAAAAYLLAGLVLVLLLRPDPYVVAIALARHRPPAAVEVAHETGSSAASRGTLLGATVMVLTQVAMVAIMTMTPVHMRAHGHDLSQVGFVIGVHIGSMYLPSLLTGALVDRVGRRPVAITAAVTLLAAGLTAARAPADSLTALTIALALLGIGWNFGLISGTALIVDSTPLSTRARTQGSVDVLVALAGAGGGALSGVVVARSSYAVLALGGGLLAVLLLPVVAWTRAGRAEAGPTTLPTARRAAEGPS